MCLCFMIIWFYFITACPSLTSLKILNILLSKFFLCYSLITFLQIQSFYLYICPLSFIAMDKLFLSIVIYSNGRPFIFSKSCPVLSSGTYYACRFQPPPICEVQDLAPRHFAFVGAPKLQPMCGLSFHESFCFIFCLPLWNLPLFMAPGGFSFWFWNSIRCILF